MAKSGSRQKAKAQAAPGGRGEPVRGQAEETRHRLVEAGLDAFGRFGFDGASTREIARRAGVNLAAIPYHFGGKEGLHRAVAEHIVEEVGARIGPMIDTVSASIERDEIAPERARTMLKMVAVQAAEVILGHPEASRWAPFILREQMDPSPTFNVIYEGFLGRALDAATALYARATGRPASDPETTAAALMLFGQLVILRIGRAMVERRLGWTAYGPDEIAVVKELLSRNLDAMIEAGRV